MSEILSQEEINALLSAYQSVNEPANGGVRKKDKEVRLYDFTKPNRFSKDHLRALNTIHSNFATEISAALPSLCPLPTRVILISVEQVSYKEYRASIPAKTLLAEVAADPLRTDIVFEVNPGVVGMWVDCLSGGDPLIVAEPSDITRLDMQVMRNVLDLFLASYTGCWSDTVSLDLRIRRMLSSETAEAMLMPMETVLVSSFELRIGPCIGMMTICIPASAIEPILPILVASHMSRAAEHDDSNAVTEAVQRAIGPVELPATVTLGRTTMSLSDAMALEVGDVIRLDNRASREIEMYVGESHMFNCRPGIIGDRVAAMVCERSEETAPTARPTDEQDTLAEAIADEQLEAVA